MSISVYVGVDVGASHTKAAVLDGGQQLLGKAVERSGVDFKSAAEKTLRAALETAGVGSESVLRSVSTGYGRKNVYFADDTKTEIACHAKGCYHFFPGAMTLIDIGGQDNKVVKLDTRGRRVSFKMNRKCAAGTGAFLEEISLRLDIPLENMDDLARSAEDIAELGSYCTVFSGTEVLEKIRQGRRVADIVKGLFLSVIKRILEMDALTDTVVMTGGVVAHNPYLVEMVKEITAKEILVPEYPQLTGAVGAALFALQGRPDNHSAAPISP